ncbi:MAG: hypothetical protein M3253_03565, partial [Chloroflexota bacterium]|nr:hypothetical protein [Chloroflexota bacterium]
LMDPFLGVVVQRAYEMGKQAAELMLERLAADGQPKPRLILLPVDFIPRRSSGPPRHDPEVRPARRAATPGRLLQSTVRRGRSRGDSVVAGRSAERSGSQRRRGQ